MKNSITKRFTGRVHLLPFLLPALLVLSLLMAGCSKPVHKNAFLDFSINPQQNEIYINGETALITTRDKRQATEVITYHSRNNQRLRVEALPTINSILTAQLAKGFAEQGLILTREEPDAYITMEVVALHADVMRDKGLYVSHVKTTLQLTVETAQQKLTKTYNRDADRKNMTKPLLQDIEVMIRDQIQEIVNQTLIDPEIRTTINRKVT